MLYKEVRSVRSDLQATVMRTNGWDLYSVGYDSEGNPTYTFTRISECSDNDGEGHYEEGND